MNFITAIQHATIGYGIRRQTWILSRWMLLDDSGHHLIWNIVPNGYGTRDGNITLLGPDPSWDITEEDIKATDWEAV